MKIARKKSQRSRKTAADHPTRVLAAIFCQDGRILIARRKKGDRFGGFWEFPGGKIEPGETPEDALTREMSEEFDILIHVGRRLGSVLYSSGELSIELEAFSAVRLSGSFALREHDQIRWVTLEECRTCRLTEPDRRLLDQLTAEIVRGSR